MPRKYRKSRKSRKTTKTGLTSREYKNKGQYRTIVHSTPFPAKWNIRLEYTGWVHDATVGDTGSSFTTAWSFKLNSIYDPYAGVTGSYNVQPYFFDQINSIYKRYLVTSAKVELRQCSPSLSTDVLTLMRPSTVSTLPSDFQLEESRPFAMKKVNTSYGNGIVMNAYYPVYKIHGVPKQKVISDDLYASTVGADPSLIMYLNVVSVNSDQSVATNKIPFNIKITQYVTMFDRNVVSGS